MAIARAYMRDAELIILDEPTAALDAKAEAEVFQRFKGLAKGKTAVLISHRFSTVRMADRILVLSGGRIIESGTHAELVAQRGVYADLFELQAAGYPVAQATSFSPMMPETISPMQARRIAVAGSPSR